MTTPEKTFSTLEEISSTVKNCTLCPLHKSATNPVPGEGTATSGILFIGEGPGKDEDLQGRPFVGRSGQILRSLIREINLQESDVFIANVVKCRPPNNRDPHPEEIQTCWPYLEAQIKILNPRLIITLGRHSMSRFLPNLKISQDHGRVFRNQQNRFFMPSYHPAVACYSPTQLETIRKDFHRIPRILQKIDEINQNNPLSSPPKPANITQTELKSMGR